MIWWIIRVIAGAILIGMAVVWLNRPMKIPHEPEREAAQDELATLAYDRSSRSLLFSFERYILLRSIRRVKPEGRLADIGCGPGYLTARLSLAIPSLKIIGLDISNLMTGIAGRKWRSGEDRNLEFLVGDAQQLPFADNSLDFILSSLSLHHWPNPSMAFREIDRVLKPSGRFLIFDLRRNSPRYVFYALVIIQLLFAPRDIRRTNGAVGSFWAAFTPSEIKVMIAGNPGNKINIETHFAWMTIWGTKSG